MRAVVLFAAMALAGCATSAQREAERIGTDVKAGVASVQSCMAALYSDPQFAAITSKLPQEPSLAHLTDGSKDTNEEGRQLLEAHPRLQACRKIAVEMMTRTIPAAVPALA